MINAPDVEHSRRLDLLHLLPFEILIQVKCLKSNYEKQLRIREELETLVQDLEIELNKAQRERDDVVDINDKLKAKVEIAIWMIRSKFHQSSKSNYKWDY